QEALTKQSMSWSKVNKRRAIVEDIPGRHQKVLELFAKGYTYQEIANMTGYESKQGPFRVVKEHLKQVREENNELAEDIRTAQLEDYAADRKRILTQIDQLVESAEDPVKKAQIIATLTNELGKIRDKEAKLAGAYA